MLLVSAARATGTTSTVSSDTATTMDVASRGQRHLLPRRPVRRRERPRGGRIEHRHDEPGAATHRPCRPEHRRRRRVEVVHLMAAGPLDAVDRVEDRSPVEQHVAVRAAAECRPVEGELRRQRVRLPRHAVCRHEGAHPARSSGHSCCGRERQEAGRPVHDVGHPQDLPPRLITHLHPGPVERQRRSGLWPRPGDAQLAQVDGHLEPVRELHRRRVAAAALAGARPMILAHRRNRVRLRVHQLERPCDHHDPFRCDGEPLDRQRRAHELRRVWFPLRQRDAGPRHGRRS
jgi:hypothetical protein